MISKFPEINPFLLISTLDDRIAYTMPTAKGRKLSMVPNAEMFRS